MYDYNVALLKTINKGIYSEKHILMKNIQIPRCSDEANQDLKSKKAWK